VELLPCSVCAELLCACTSRRGRGRTQPLRAAAQPADGLRRGLAAARRRLIEQVDAALGRAPAGLDAVFAELEEALVAADVGMRTTATLLDRLRQRVGRSTEPAEVRRALREEMVAMLDAPPSPAPTGRPWVILVTGVNGVGKTT